MFEYVFPLTESFPSHIFYSSVSSIGHIPFLSHVGSERCVIYMGIKPKKTLCREGSTIGDCQNLYLWFSEEKTEEELKIIYQCILQTIEENSSISDDTQTIELGGDIEMDQLV